MTQSKLIKQEASATGRTGLPGSAIGDAISSAAVSILLSCTLVLRALLEPMIGTLLACRHY